MGKLARIWPRWVQTVGNMQDAIRENPELQVQAMCGTCNTAFRVELDLLIMANGRNFCLIDQHGKCRKVRCPGRVVFMFSNGPSTPFMTMTTPGKFDGF